MENLLHDCPRQPGVAKAKGQTLASCLWVENQDYQNAWGNDGACQGQLKKQTSGQLPAAVISVDVLAEPDGSEQNGAVYEGLPKIPKAHPDVQFEAVGDNRGEGARLENLVYFEGS